MRITPNSLFIDGKNYQLFSGVCVYIWRRGKHVLYVGCSGRGLGRVFANHHVINHVEKVQEQDEIEIISFTDPQAALIKEIELIKGFTPKYNPDMPLNKSHECRILSCLVCGREFKQTRYWQKYCSIQCKQTTGPA